MELRKNEDIISEALSEMFGQEDNGGMAVGWTIAIDYVLPTDDPTDSRTRIISAEGQRHTTTLGQLVVANDYTRGLTREG